MTESSTSSLGRFSVTSSVQVRSVLEAAATAPTLDQATRAACQEHATAARVPWRLLRQACDAVRASSDDPGSAPWLHQLARSAGIAFDAPPPRVRSQQLQERLRQLQEKLDNDRYAAMVADITKEEVAAEDLRREGNFFPSTRLQLSFGLHVIVTMGTFALLGYYFGHFTTGDPTWAAALAALGMTAAMLMETVLMMIRTSGMQHIDDKYAHLMDPKKYGSTRQRQWRREGSGGGSSGRGAPAATRGGAAQDTVEVQLEPSKPARDKKAD